MVYLHVVLFWYQGYRCFAKQQLALSWAALCGCGWFTSKPGESIGDSGDSEMRREDSWVSQISICRFSWLRGYRVIRYLNEKRCWKNCMQTKGNLFQMSRVGVFFCLQLKIFLLLRIAANRNSLKYGLFKTWGTTGKLPSMSILDELSLH